MQKDKHTTLRHEHLPNAVFGAMLGIGIASSGGLSERPDNLLPMLVEGLIVLSAILILTLTARAGGLWIKERKTLRGVLTCLFPMVIAGGFIWSRRNFLTFGDLILVDVLYLWWISFLAIGLFERFRGD